MLQVGKESEQIQQMYYMDKEQTALKVLTTNIYNNLNRIIEQMKLSQAI